ncbi:MAG: aldehyde dehydrogenase family protein [Bdellovibrionales bacterium]|nr:aldehyde dehydrogenase family protein [Bdellovibrionales bacterium]
MKIINPATGTLLREIPETNATEIKAKLDRAVLSQSAWKKTSMEERLKCIKNFHELLDKEREILARDLTLEVGKPIQESINELSGARNRIRFFLEQTEATLAENPVRTDGGMQEIITHDPLGVIANISAWNYPYLVGVNVFIPALLAGNGVLYKPSEFATLTGLHIERLLHEAGIPKELFTAVIGGAQAGEELLNLPLQGYFFTGSYKTGRLIAEKVSSKLVPVGLELGGKDPLYVTDEVLDLKKTANSVAEGCFYNNGQSCCAVERVYVHARVYDEFIQHLRGETLALRAGNPMDRGFQQGSLTRPSQIEFLESQIEDAVKKGAKVLVGGKRIPGPGAFFEPTLLIDVNHDMAVMREESFGPIIGVMKVNHDEEAIRLMNDTDYGLTAAVYSFNTERAKSILSKVDSGTAYVNCCDRVSPYLPWAGRKNSGLGATLSTLGILAFTRPRGWHIRG